MWISAFPVYSIPLLFVLIYLWIWFSGSDRKCQSSKLLPIGTLLLGIAGTLCVEHMTIYSCSLAIFVLIYTAANKQKICAYQITYLIGTLFGAVLMFTNHNYYSVYGDGDVVGVRSFEFGISDVFFQMYQNVLPRFAKQFPLIHCLIAAAFFVLLCRTDRSEWKPERKRYVKLTFFCELLYAFYAMFVNCNTDLENLTPLFRVAAMEAALVFLHIVSIIYLAWVLVPRTRFLRVTLYIVSAFITSAVFCVVNPVTGRCFFSDFCFWLLCSLELLDYVLELYSQIETHAKKIMCVFGCAAACFMTYINVINKVVFNTSIAFLKEQRANKLTNLSVIELPYSDYSPGKTLVETLQKLNIQDTDEKAIMIRQWYVSCLEEYYGIEVDYEGFDCHTVSYYMYNL